MKRSVSGFLILATAGLLTGCVERRYVITSDPPGAIVLENGKPLGPTPADGSFVYYGDYHFTLMHDGFETLQVNQHIPTPWYEFFPLDFFTENFLPWRIKDVRRFHYSMQPLAAARSDQVLNRGQQLRERAATIGPPPGAEKQPPAPGSPPLPQLQQPVLP